MVKLAQIRGVLVQELYSAARSACGKINENKFSIVRSIQVFSPCITAKSMTSDGNSVLSSIKF